MLWEAILLDNADNVSDAIDTIQEQLQNLKGMLNPKSAVQLRAWLELAARKRRSLDASGRSSPGTPGDSPSD